MTGAVRFDPGLHGFGFRNPVGVVRDRGIFFRRLDPFLYGNGLCFGMVVAALREFSAGRGRGRMSELPLSPDLLDELFSLHARQYRPKAVLAVVLDWLRSVGGRPDGVANRIRLPESGDPHVLCFGPGANRSFFRCLRRAHAVAPYRIEEVADETRLFVYDPNYPKDRDRHISFRDGGFRYGGFASEEGWGISLLPLSALGRTGVCGEAQEGGIGTRRLSESPSSEAQITAE